MLHTVRRLLTGLAAMAGLLAMGAAQATDIVLQPIQLSPHVYYFGGHSGMASVENQGYMSNAGFVVTHDGVLVFDALGTPALGRAMVAAVAKVTDQPIKRVIVSHYHADHLYGLQAFKALGAEVWAHEGGHAYFTSGEAQERLAQRRADLVPWVDENTQVISADRWLNFPDGKPQAFKMGGMHFQLIDVSGSHSAGDIMLFVQEEAVLFAGDLFFTGRLPFVGNADSKAWLAALERIADTNPAVVVPGHGVASTDPKADIQLTREYLLYLRKEMGAAVDDMADFEQAYAQTDWSAYENYPAFQDANRLNAYGTYLLMEKESLGG